MPRPSAAFGPWSGPAPPPLPLLLLLLLPLLLPLLPPPPLPPLPPPPLLPPLLLLHIQQQQHHAPPLHAVRQLLADAPPRRLDESCTGCDDDRERGCATIAKPL